MDTYNKHLIHNELTKAKILFANVGSEAEEFGYSFDDMVLSCFHAGVLCNKSDFVLFQSPDFFNCYTYTVGNQYQNSILAGPEHGLTLMLYSESVDLVLGSAHNPYEYLNPIGNAKGYRVLIHAPETFPNINEEGIDILPGVSTSISLSMSKETRVDSPYSDCYNSKLRGGFRTDLNTCRMMCKDKLIEMR